MIDLIEDPLVQLEYISCMIKDNIIPDDAGERVILQYIFNVSFAHILLLLIEYLFTNIFVLVWQGV